MRDMRVLLLCLIAGSLLAADTPKAKPEDVQSMDSIVAALYDVISGPAGQKRDWDRMHSLFIPEGRLIALRTTPEGTQTRVMTVDDYVARSGKILETNGFFESEVSRKTEEFGGIAHIFSTYESRHAVREKPFARGINSIQLMKDKDRWYVVQILWDSERPDQPIPPRYLPATKPLARN
jgi:hypothetical protein